MSIPSSVWSWTFTLVTLIQGLAVIGLESYAFALFQQALVLPAAIDPTVVAGITAPGLPPPLRFVYTRTVPTFLALYIFAVIYQFILTIDALRMRNVLQVIGLVVLNILLMAYGAVQRVQVEDAVNQLMPAIDYAVKYKLVPISQAVISIFAVGSLILSIIAWKLYQEFAWTIYKSISADLRMKRRYLFYQVYLALLKFDFFFFLGFTVQWLVVLEAQYNQDFEFPLTVAAVPVTIIILLLAAVSVRRENIWGTLLVMLFYLAALAYFIFKLARIWVGDKRAYYQAVAKPMTTFASIDIALLVVTIAICIKTATNFNRGLKEHLGSEAQRKHEVEDGKIYPNNEMTNLAYPGAAPMPSRMTIE